MLLLCVPLPLHHKLQSRFPTFYLLASYKGENYIREQIQSLLEQTVTDILSAVSISLARLPLFFVQ